MILTSLITTIETSKRYSAVCCILHKLAGTTSIKQLLCLCRRLTRFYIPHTLAFMPYIINFLNVREHAIIFVFRMSSRFNFTVDTCHIFRKYTALY